MSYLIRTGTGRNNIAFTNTANSSTKYLRRTASGRTSIVWTTIPAGSTYNILNRTGTGRNNIAWANLNIPMPTGQPVTSSDLPDITARFSGGGRSVSNTFNYNGYAFKCSYKTTGGNINICNNDVSVTGYDSASTTNIARLCSISLQYIDFDNSTLMENTMPNVHKATIYFNSSNWICYNLSFDSVYWPPSSSGSIRITFNVSNKNMSFANDSAVSSYIASNTSARLILSSTW